tara:strand:+ start:4310 stop:4615 length:306 start_codon:yes stop_codon:yes gene_type:complete
MIEVTGLIANNINQPNKKDVAANTKNILKFEYPKTFRERRSVLFLRPNINHMLEIKIINGNNLIIIFGIYNAVRVKGIKNPVSKFLKNSISSNRFSINPKP